MVRRGGGGLGDAVLRKAKEVRQQLMDIMVQQKLPLKSAGTDWDLVSLLQLGCPIFTASSNPARTCSPSRDRYLEGRIVLKLDA